MPRFFVEKITHPVVLSLEESRHAVRVLRMNPGDRAVVFDLRETWSGEIESIARNVTIRLIEELPSPRLPHVVVASAVPKGARLDWMVEKLAEIGVSEFIPLKFTRSVVEPGEGKRKRLEKIVLAAAKQSGAPVMQIHPERGVAEVAKVAWLAAPGGALPAPTGGGMVVIGPEGGLTADEEALFVRRFSLGPTILRIETAAVVAAARLLS
jgi:16S rRNA (uracil1498-N3)-methyltransferase